MQITERILHKHPFFKGVHDWYLEQLGRYAHEQRLEDGDYLICEGMDAKEFYLIMEGEVAVGISSPEREFRPVQTLRAHDIVGWSWLLPPHKWHFDAVAVGSVKVIVLDGVYLRTKCEEDPALGYELTKRIAGHIIDRLIALRSETVRSM